MLNENGKLAYITPNSWLTSTAGTNFRNYLKESKTLLEIYQYGHYKVFAGINTYTCITLLSKTPKTNNMFVCYRNTCYMDLKFIQTIENLEECMINGNIYLTDKETLNILKEIDEINIKTKKNLNRIRVKNGFATLNDKLFIIDDFIKDNKEFIIQCCKTILNLYSIFIFFINILNIGKHFQCVSICKIYFSVYHTVFKIFHRLHKV